MDTLKKIKASAGNNASLPELLDVGSEIHSGARVTFWRDQGKPVHEIEDVDVGLLVCHIGSGLAVLHVSLYCLKEA